MGRGGGGSGRSSGGSRSSSSRSSGGRMSSSGRGGGSSYRSSSSHRGGGFSSTPSYRPPSYHRVGGHYGAPPPPYGGGYPYPPRSYRPMGCLTQLVALIFTLVILAVVLGTLAGGGSGSITKSTVAREPLEKGAVITTDYYTDELGWIRSGTQLQKGMKNFFKETGVQPYLYITDTVNGTVSPSSADMDAYAAELYDELFEDEGHFLLLFHEYNSNSQYSMWYTCGAQAKTVMDQEACDILMDYVDKYYYSDLSEDELFSKAFDEAAERIMAVTKSPMPTIIICFCALLGAWLAFVWWKKAKAQRNLEAEQTERLLNTDLHTFGSQSASSLEDKYKDD